MAVTQGTLCRLKLWWRIFFLSMQQKVPQFLLICHARSSTHWLASCMLGLDYLSWAPSTTSRAPPTPHRRCLGLSNGDLWCRAWTCLWRPASCWAMLGLMNKRPPKRRRIWADSAVASPRELRLLPHAWGTDARMVRDGAQAKISGGFACWTL